jgi:hypothetical protein
VPLLHVAPVHTSGWPGFVPPLLEPPLLDPPLLEPPLLLPPSALPLELLLLLPFGGLAGPESERTVTPESPASLPPTTPSSSSSRPSAVPVAHAMPRSGMEKTAKKAKVRARITAEQ